jgi:hypothetical protein
MSIFQPGPFVMQSFPFRRRVGDDKIHVAASRSHLMSRLGDHGGAVRPGMDAFCWAKMGRVGLFRPTAHSFATAGDDLAR